jgi:hypothetical protein
MMKQLLADIVKKITQNLLGKSTIESSTNDNSRSVCIQSIFPHLFFLINRVNYLFDLLYVIIMI